MGRTNEAAGKAGYHHGDLRKALLEAAEAELGEKGIEAFSLREPGSFLLGVQWHPEWEAADNPVSVSLFTAFAQACRAHAARRCATA